MKIGIDCRLPYYERGGISRYTLNLIRSISQQDLANEYILYQLKKDTNSYLPENTKNFSRRKVYTPCHHRFERLTLAFEIAGQGLDLFHSPDFIPPSFGARRLLITVHDLNFLYYPQFLTAESRRYYLNQISWAVRRADHIIADSRHTMDDIINHFQVDPDKVSDVHLAANPIFAQPHTESEIELTLNKYNLERGFILFVGTLSPRKNLTSLIRWYSKFREKTRLKNTLVMVGRKGWLYDEIFDEIVRLKLQEDTIHLQGVEDRQLVHLYKSAGLLVLPSYYEGFGFPALEAMTAGCPVIASNRSSLPEVVGEAGILLDPEDEQGWVDAMTTLLSDSTQRDKFVSDGRKQAKRFSWRKTASRTLEIYRVLANQ